MQELIHYRNESWDSREEVGWQSPALYLSQCFRILKDGNVRITMTKKRSRAMMLNNLSSGTGQGEHETVSFVSPALSRVLHFHRVAFPGESWS